MANFKIYSVSDRYIKFLEAQVDNVFSNKENARTHTRKYIGVVFEKNGFNYFIPMSSPKNSDYIKAEGEKSIIRKSIVPIVRMTEKTRTGEEKLLGTLKISNMIPVPASELIPYDSKKETDRAYRGLIDKEILFIRENAKSIKSKANVMYNQKINGMENIGYVKAALDFKKAEKNCERFMGLRQEKKHDKSKFNIQDLKEKQKENKEQNKGEEKVKKQGVSF